MSSFSLHEGSRNFFSIHSASKNYKIQFLLLISDDDLSDDIIELVILDKVTYFFKD